MSIETERWSRDEEGGDVLASDGCRVMCFANAAVEREYGPAIAVLPEALALLQRHARGFEVTREGAADVLRRAGVEP